MRDKHRSHILAYIFNRRNKLFAPYSIARAIRGLHIVKKKPRALPINFPLVLLYIFLQLPAHGFWPSLPNMRHNLIADSIPLREGRWVKRRIEFGVYRSLLPIHWHRSKWWAATATAISSHSTTRCVYPWFMGAMRNNVFYTELEHLFGSLITYSLGSLFFLACRYVYTIPATNSSIWLACAIKRWKKNTQKNELHKVFGTARSTTPPPGRAVGISRSSSLRSCGSEYLNIVDDGWIGGWGRNGTIAHDVYRAWGVFFKHRIVWST